MEKMNIKRIAGKWLLNGKQYSELEGKEKTFFDEFIIAMRWQYECFQYDKRLKKAS